MAKNIVQTKFRSVNFIRLICTFLSKHKCTVINFGAHKHSIFNLFPECSEI